MSDTERPTLPAASVARTANVCGPSALAPVRFAVKRPSEQPTHAPPSSEQSRVAPAPVNSHVGVVSVPGVGGRTAIVGGGGGSRSRTYERVTSGPWLPAASTARTASVWTPSAVRSTRAGEVHGAHAPPSTEHWAVAPDSTVKAHAGDGLLLGDTGSAVNAGGPGARRSSTKWRVAASPWLPAVSVARTATV